MFKRKKKIYFQGKEDRLRHRMTKEALKRIRELDAQIADPSREGMLAALQASRKMAPLLIGLQEVQNGGVSLEQLDKCTDCVLYQKLSLYRIGLENYCIGQVGRGEFERTGKGSCEEGCSVHIIFQ